MTLPGWRLIGDDVISIEMPDAASAQAYAADLRLTGDWPEVVAGLDSVCVYFDPMKCVPDELLSGPSRIVNVERVQDAVTLDIPVYYGGDDGPDLGRVCEQLGLSEDEVIRLHCSAAYTAEMIGFTPGFVYLGGLDAALSVSRLETPRVRVPSGSIGISGAYSGLYALAGPGGWPIIGRTDFALFDVSEDDPFRVHPGNKVRFVPA